MPFLFAAFCIWFCRSCWSCLFVYKYKLVSCLLLCIGFSLSLKNILRSRPKALHNTMMSVFISSINTLNYSSSHQVHNVVQDSSICIYCSLFLPGKANLNIYSGGVLEAYLFAQIYWKRQDKSAGTSAENTCPKGVKGLHSALAASC